MRNAAAASSTIAPPPERGGDLVAAIARFGGDAAGRPDPAAGVDALAWPPGRLSAQAWTRLAGLPPQAPA